MLGITPPGARAAKPSLGTGAAGGIACLPTGVQYLPHAISHGQGHIPAPPSPCTLPETQIPKWEHQAASARLQQHCHHPLGTAAFPKPENVNAKPQ